MTTLNKNRITAIDTPSGPFTFSQLIFLPAEEQMLLNGVNPVILCTTVLNEKPYLMPRRNEKILAHGTVEQDQF
ncbi:MAG: hypothetical protein ACU88J_02285 [Gammaproteobacteria bacterium]